MKFRLSESLFLTDFYVRTLRAIVFLFAIMRVSQICWVGIESGLVLYKTNEVAMHIIDLWYDCAMHEDCIAPKNTGIYGCNFNQVKPGSLQYIGCHRFDQSALNVVIVREYGKEVYKYITDSLIDTTLNIVRHPSNEFTVKKC